MRRLFGGMLILKLLVPFIFLVLIIQIVAIPVMELDDMAIKFREWFSKNSSNYSDMNAAYTDWVKTLDNEYTVQDKVIGKEALLYFINKEPRTYLHDINMKVTETIKTDIVDTGGTNSSTSTTLEHDYKLKLADATYKYRLHWQLMFAKFIYMYEPEEYERWCDYYASLFGSKFFGLLKSNEGTPIEQSSLLKEADMYKYQKKVVKVSESKEEYYKEEKEEKEVFIGYDEQGLPMYDKKDDKVKKGPYYKTTTITKTIKYPLPYFDKIEGMLKSYYFTYKEETTKDGDTTITQPVLVNTSVSSEEFDYAKNLNTIGIDGNVYSMVLDALRLLPEGVEIADSLMKVGTNLYNYKNFDLYYLADSGFGTNMYKQSGNGQFIWPVNCNINITSGFGMRMHPIFKTLKFHSGIDIGAAQGVEVYSSDDGEVIFAGVNGGYGNLVKISHNNGLSTYYAHLSIINVAVGDNVKKGQLIGRVGSTGNSTGPHLHYEVRLNESPQDPVAYLGLVLDIPQILPSDLAYIDADIDRLKEYLKGRNSVLAEGDYLDDVIRAGKMKNVNPLLLLAITGQEQSYVVNSNSYWEKVYSYNKLKSKIDKVLLLRGESITAEYVMENGLVPRYIANNCFNVYHSWWEYNTTLFEASAIACNTINRLSKNRPEGVDPIEWINLRSVDGVYRGGYAEDVNWHIGVSANLRTLRSKCGL